MRSSFPVEVRASTPDHILFLQIQTLQLSFYSQPLWMNPLEFVVPWVPSLFLLYLADHHQLSLEQFYPEISHPQPPISVFPPHQLNLEHAPLLKILDHSRSPILYTSFVQLPRIRAQNMLKVHYTSYAVIHTTVRFRASMVRALYPGIAFYLGNIVQHNRAIQIFASPTVSTVMLQWELNTGSRVVTGTRKYNGGLTVQRSSLAQSVTGRQNGFLSERKSTNTTNVMKGVQCVKRFIGTKRRAPGGHSIERKLTPANPNLDL